MAASKAVDRHQRLGKCDAEKKRLGHPLRKKVKNCETESLCKNRNSHSLFTRFFTAECGENPATKEKFFQANFKRVFSV